MKRVALSLATLRFRFLSFCFACVSLMPRKCTTRDGASCSCFRGGLQRKGHGPPSYAYGGTVAGSFRRGLREQLRRCYAAEVFLSRSKV